MLYEVITLAVALLALSGSLDRKGREIVDGSFDQALVVFGTAKALNAVISVVHVITSYSIHYTKLYEYPAR